MLRDGEILAFVRGLEEGGSELQMSGFEFVSMANYGLEDERYAIDFFLYLFDHYGRILLKGELFIKKNFPTRIHLPILTYPGFGKATIREVSPFLHEVPIESVKIFLDFITALKES